MPASLESSVGTAPSVLLVEEYDALTAAITSALKKFAPEHRICAVESLNEAEAAAAQTHPQLFIIDLDPPHPSAIEFLNRVSTTHPEVRALVIASGTSVDFASERFGPNGLQFIEKPFELTVFGAAVQALLGPWIEPATGGSRGTLRDLNLRDLIPLECVSGATAILRIVAEGGRTGEIHFLEGHISHASTSRMAGTEALSEILLWKRAHAKEHERPTNAPRTIQGPWQHVFLEALEKAKAINEHATITSTPAPSVETPKPATVPPKNGKKIVVIDDTEMLSIFVEDVLSTADSNLQIFTEPTGGGGAQRTEEIIPDLVLLDYSLPDLRGDKVCERLLRNEETARIPVIIMSGHVPEMMATADRCPNVVATIAKPFMSGALVSLVKKTLANGPLPAGMKVRAVLPSVAKSDPSENHQKQSAPAASSNGESREPMKVVQTPPPPLAPSSSIEIAPALATTTLPTFTESPVQDLAPARRIRVESPALSSPILPAGFASPGGAVVLAMSLEVIAVQFTSRFQIDAIRARPIPTTLSLNQVKPPLVEEDRWGVGFQLGIVQLGPDGRITTIRVVPMRRPAAPTASRNGFAINDVRVTDERAFIQLTAGASPPMTIQATTLVKAIEVELSDRFEVAQLVIKPESNRLRATLDQRTPGESGTEFETVRVCLDSSARLTELVLQRVAGA